MTIQSDDVEAAIFNAISANMPEREAILDAISNGVERAFAAYLEEHGING